MDRKLEIKGQEVSEKKTGKMKKFKIKIEELELVTKKKEISRILYHWIVLIPNFERKK